MVDSIDFTLTQQTGYSGITSFTATPIIYAPDDYPLGTKYLWSFGDGATSSQRIGHHTYHSPGNYTITLILYFTDTTIFTVSKIVTVNLLLNESIYFHYVPAPTFAGHISQNPFRVCITSSDVGDHYIDLGSQFSRSNQHPDTEDKWTFLSPNWAFYDLKGNLVQKIKTTDTILRATSSGKLDPNGTFVAGVTGYADFFFVDNIYNTDLAVAGHPYTLVVATLETSATKSLNFQTDSQHYMPSYANSLATVSVPYLSLWRTPDTVKVSENGIRAHSNPRWSTAETPVVVSTITTEPYPDLWFTPTPLSKDKYFNHNFPLSNSNPISIQVGSSAFDVTVLPDSSPSLVWTDYSLFKTPGYYKGSINIPDVNTLGVTISAEVSLSSPNLAGNIINPLLWIPNPEAGGVVVAQYTNKSAFSAVSVPNLSAAHVYFFESPQSYGKTSGIYSIAADIIPSFGAWAIDTDAQKLYRFTSMGQVLCSVDLQGYASANGLLNSLQQEQSAPFGLAVDGEKSMWITLHDTPYTIKLDSRGNYLSAITLPISSMGYQIPIPNTLLPNNQSTSWWDQDSSITYYADIHNMSAKTLSSFRIAEAVQLLQPAYIDTDTYNNVLVTYTDPFSGVFAKFDYYGNLQYTVSYNYNFTPQEFVVDASNQTWLSISNNFNRSADRIELRSTNGSPISAFGPINNINNLTIDKDQNCYFTFGYNQLGKITPQGLTASMVVADSLSFVNGDVTALEGVAADMLGKIYVINSVENRIYVINSSFIIENTFFVNPQGFVNYQDDSGNYHQYYGAGNKSAAALGDWSGLRWSYKYAAAYLSSQAYTTGTISLTGASRPLDFYIDNSISYDLFKVNENYSISDEMKKLAYMPVLQESEFLFDSFIGKIFGKAPFAHEDLGTAIYEKIANFVSNHSDIDTCNIDQLYNLAQMTDLDTDDFRLLYPESIKRLVDIVSINPKRLWGSMNAPGHYFVVPNREGIFNRGKPITSLSYQLSSGTPVVLQYKSTDKYQIINTGPINGFYTYSINTLALYLQLDSPWSDHYMFHEYIADAPSSQLEGVIDWSNEQTSINSTLSSVDLWQGTEGIAETMFAYELYKGLNLLN